MAAFQKRLAGVCCLFVMLAMTSCDDDPAPEGGTDAASDGGDVGSDSGADTSLDTTDSATDTPDETVPPASSVSYDLAAALADDFFAFPYPSDLRLNSEGGPDLGSFPTNRAPAPLLASAAEIVETELVGFSPLSAVYIRFEVALGAASLPGTTADTTSAESHVYLMDVTPSSPDYGTRHPVVLGYNDEGGGYWPAHTLVLRPPYGMPLRPGTTYAAVVTTGVLDPDGNALTPPPLLVDLEAALAGEAATLEQESLRPLVEALADQDVSADTLLAATVFTTSDPYAQLVEIRDWMVASLEEPITADWVAADREGYTLYTATVDSVELFSGEAPYESFGSGLIALDGEGAPEAVTDIDLTFALSIPDGEVPDGGFPLLIYGHGLGEDYLGFVRTAAGPMAARGVAVLGISPPLQGERNPTGTADTDLIVQLAISNIVAGREILRQGVVDFIRIAQLVDAGLEVPADVAVGGVAIPLSSEAVAFFGHSEGAQIAALFAPIEPLIDTVAMTAGGGGGGITMLELTVQDIDVAALVARAVGVNTANEDWDLQHPVLTAIIQPLLDPADPLHAARHFFLEPLAGSGPRNWVMTEGFLDALTPPASTEALAAAAQLPIAEPVGRPIAELDLQAIDPVALPADANLPEVDGIEATGALIQLPEQDHYLIYFNEVARTQLFDFLDSALDGAAVLPAAVEVAQ